MTPDKLVPEARLHLVDMSGIEAVRMVTSGDPAGVELAYKLGNLQVTPRNDFPVFRDRPTLTVIVDDVSLEGGAASRVRAALELTTVNGWY